MALEVMTLEEADMIQDFTLVEDVIDLIDGVGFADLTIVQGSGDLCPMIR
jgi:hypothetical protein